MPETYEEYFSQDYFSARERFRAAAAEAGFRQEALPIDRCGPGGELLTIDVACSQHGDPQKTLVVSSGLHGVEGFPGSAVQLALLNHWSCSAQPPIRCVLIHGLNPYGFAWLRRFDENNIDPNRNFLLPGERFAGSPDGYSSLDRFLNPRSPPSRWEPFLLKSLWLIARYGLPTLRQAIAAGQHEFPRGLFFAGHRPTQTQLLLQKNLPRWLQGAKLAVHLDVHSGLGRSGACKLLIDYPLNQQQNYWLTDWFGANSFEPCNSSGISYDARGGFGRWCVHQDFAPEYLFACAEFGTWGPIHVLEGLRAENRAFHWGSPGAQSTAAAKQRLVELFCPKSTRWRSQVIRTALAIVAQAQHGLLQTSLS